MTLPVSSAITRYEIPWLELDWPIEWGSFFGRSAPLISDIGFGNGGFLIQQALLHPNCNYLGIERSWGSLQRLFKGLDRRGIENVRVLQSGASFAMDYLMQPESIQEVFINFSDPWPKERHHRRRLIQPEFIQLLSERLTPQGMVTIATDHPDYAVWIVEVLENQTALRSCHRSSSVSHLEDRRPTKYELKATRRSIPIHYFEWRREGDVATSSTEAKVGEMPNVILTGAYVKENLLDDLPALSWQGEDGDVNVVVKLTGIYEGRDGNRLVEAMAREGEFSQHFGVLVTGHTDGGLLIKLSLMGHPRPTFGVKQAVRMVMQTILDQFPSLRIRSSTLEELRDD